MKKYIKQFLITFIIVTTVLFFTTFSGKRSDVFLHDFTVTEDGNTMVLEVGVASSAGYIRKITTETEGNAISVAFYSTFGINNSMGAQDTFFIGLSGEIDEIYFLSDNDEFKLTVQKDMATGLWAKVK